MTKSAGLPGSLQPEWKRCGYPASGPPAGDPLKPFVTWDDIVHTLQRGIAILEAPIAPPNFSKRQAVCWIVHLVGDLHQPMHVTIGYDKTTLVNFANKPTRINTAVISSRHKTFCETRPSPSVTFLRSAAKRPRC